MSWKLPSIISAAVITILFTPAIGFADLRLQTQSLPEPLINTEQCLNVNSHGWGWNGEQPCFVTGFRIYGASFPLTQTQNDYGGGALAWSRDDVADKVVRCDSFRLSHSVTAKTTSGYIRDRYDITFLTQDTIPLSSSEENLTEVTAHLYARGWEVGRSGRLETGLFVDFNTIGFTTGKGYIFINDSEFHNSNNEYLVNKFSHCYFRNKETPLRATGYCVDYDGDGVGWNGGEACEVKSVDTLCDYSAASDGSNFGWGYNPVTGQSCPPADSTSAYVAKDQCIANGPDGWGWNEALQESCQIN